MPVPNPRNDEQEQDYISRCISELYDEYGQEQSAAICYSKWRENNMSVEDGTDEESQRQGGVVPSVFSKFQFRPNNKEPMVDFMNRCMSDSMVREKKKDRANRAGFCYSEYQTRYIASLAKRWK